MATGPWFSDRKSGNIRWMAASAQRTKGRAVLKQSYVLECAGREWRTLEGRTCREMTAGMGVGGGRKGGRIRREG